jgi:[ribosomal protein S18]-alanine N-acetyltransferase
LFPIKHKPKMEINYRQISENDYFFLRKMLYEALFVPEEEKPLPESILDVPEISRYIEGWSSSDFGIIAQGGAELIGAVWGRLFTYTNKGYGYVDDRTPELTMAVKNRYRNMGIGGEMMNKFLLLAKRNGYNAVSLSVDKRNRAVGFYLNIGFTIIDETGTAYTMKKFCNDTAIN